MSIAVKRHVFSSDPQILVVMAYLKALSPYVAVTLGLWWLRSACLSLLLYHAFILLWFVFRQTPWTPIRGWWRHGWLLLVPSGLAGLLAWLLLPSMLLTPSSLAQWFVAMGLGPWSQWLLLAYFGLLHPLLEQQHWQPLRLCLGWRAHTLFAGYHALVLAMFIRPPWLLLCLLVLLMVSRVWQALSQVTGGSLLAILTHMLADTGLVLAAIVTVNGF